MAVTFHQRVSCQSEGLQLRAPVRYAVDVRPCRQEVGRQGEVSEGADRRGRAVRNRIDGGEVVTGQHKPLQSRVLRITVSAFLQAVQTAQTYFVNGLRPSHVAVQSVNSLLSKLMTCSSEIWA